MIARALAFRTLAAVASLLAAVALLGASPAEAAESSPVSSARATVSVVSDTDLVQPGVPFRVALRIRAAPGWHTYWQNPGDAGLPPDIALKLPPGAQAGPVSWPAPRRFAEGPVTTYGYTGDVLLPMVVTAPAGPFALAAHATWLICKDICVPEEGDFRLELPQGSPAPSAQAPLFQAAATPLRAPWPVRIAADATLTVAGADITPARVADAWFMPLRWGLVDHSSPQVATVIEGGLSLATRRGVEFDPAADVPGLLVLKGPDGQERAYAVDATPGAIPLPDYAPSVPLARVLLFGLLGGVILNLMPCVFPVLAIKALGLARLRNADRRQVRLNSASFVAGVMVTFLALGGLMVALRAGGSAVGWGFQFQSPVFVAAMGWVLFAVGLNLSGLFEVGLGFSGMGQALVHRHGYAGSFFTGLLAVLVATPCTAPFMGVAIATALTSSSTVTFGVFAALGLGFALPFAVLASIPALLRFMPRPGNWMVVLKQVLAFPMYAAALWLLWVLSQQSGPDGVLAAGSGLILLGLSGWALGLAQRQVGGRRIAQAVALVALAAAVAILPSIGLASTGATTVARMEPGAEPFTAARLAALRAAGRPVFVNVTAAWCVTCLVNERLALSPARVRQVFADRHVTYLKGDWTRQDPEITAFLRAHGRDGVPLYVMFPADSAPARVLPQVLTAGTVMAQLDR